MQIRGRRIYSLGSVRSALTPFRALPPCCVCPAPVLPTTACPASRRTCRLLGVPSQNPAAHVTSLPSARAALVKVSTIPSFPLRSGSPPRSRGRGGHSAVARGLGIPGMRCILSRGSDPSIPRSFSIFTVLESLSGSTNCAVGRDTTYAASQLLSS